MLQAVECGWETEMNKHQHISNHGGDFDKKIDAERAAALVEMGRKLSKRFSGLNSQSNREWEERTQYMK